MRDSKINSGHKKGKQKRVNMCTEDTKTSRFNVALEEIRLTVIRLQSANEPWILCESRKLQNLRSFGQFRKEQEKRE